MTPDAEPRPSSPTVLVVEDDVLVRAVLAETLRGEGYVVVEAENAEAALQFLATATSVDLVFSDVRMPGAINGVELARRLARERPEVPVILTSGDVDPEQLRGIGGFLAKPYKLDHAMQMVAELLGRNAGA